MNYGTFSTVKLAYFPFYCEGLDQKRNKKYDEAIFFLTKAFNLINEEKIVDRPIRIAKEKILLQRASVLVSEGDYNAASNDATNALGKVLFPDTDWKMISDLGISTRGYFVLAVIAKVHNARFLK